MIEVIEAATIADRFLAARRAGDGLAAYPGVLPSSLDEAYAIQDAAIARWGKRVVGWKVGRIMPPLDTQFGSDRLTGPIFSSVEPSGSDAPVMPVFAAGFAAGEAEFLLRIGTTPPEGKTSFSLDEAADLIDAVHVGIEVASSPLGDINRIGPMAVVSDFGNNNGLVIGDAIPDWRDSGFEDWDVVTLIDGVQAGTGRARAFPNGAIGAAAFLFGLMARRGIVLRPGQWISSGAVTGIHDAAPGQVVEARFNDQYSVACRLSAVQPQ